MIDFLEWAFVISKEGQAALVVLAVFLGVLATVLWSDYRYYQWLQTMPWNR